MSKRYAVFLTVLFCAFLGCSSPPTSSPGPDVFPAGKPLPDPATLAVGGGLRMRLPLRDSGDFYRHVHVRV